ncbi:PepSY domain-containing protein [Methylosinus sp. Sm6]|uniref:PepSY domain-containing protein n=1 Tax=Methylosinus sp. Sm6 TaxID=2866948 RepID=UPI00351CBA87
MKTCASSSFWPKIAAMLALAAPARGELARGEEAALQCFPMAETRHLIADRRLADPFASMQAASSAAHAEPIAAKLCRDREALVYEISVLRRDGRVLRIYLDATNGQPHPGHKSR